MKLEKLAPLLPSQGVAVSVNGLRVTEHVPLNKYFGLEVVGIEARGASMVASPYIEVFLVGEEHDS